MGYGTRCAGERTWGHSRSRRMLFLQYSFLAMAILLVAGGDASGQGSAAAPQICLQVHCFDPFVDPVVPKELRGLLPPLRPAVSGKQYVLLQRIEPIDQAWQEAVREAGGEPIGYFPENTLLVAVPPQDRTVLSSLFGVRWMGDFLPAYRLSSDAANALRTGTPSWARWEDGDFRLQAQFFLGEDPSEYKSEILSLLPKAKIEYLSAAKAAGYPWGTIVVRVVQGQLRAAIAALASTGGVQHVAFYLWAEPRVDDSVWFLQTGEADIGLPKNYDTTARLFTHGLTGAGEVAGVVDSGLQHRLCHFLYGGNPTDVTDSTVVPLVDPLPVSVTAPQNKVITYYRLGTNPEGDCDSVSRHGTQVTGIMAGDNWACRSIADFPFSPDDCAPSNYGFGVQHHDLADGIGPGAQIVFQGYAQTGCTGLPQLNTPGFQTTLHTQAYNTSVPPPVDSGVRVHNDSYGTRPIATDYSVYEQALDAFQWGFRDYLLTWPVMNRDPSPNTFAHPEHFKDGLSTGASAHAPEPTPFGPGEDLWRVSAHGPGAGDRVKPDVVAPGQSLRAAADLSQQSPPLGTCVSILGFSGTSFAGPSIGGLGVQVRQYFRRGYYPSGLWCPIGDLTGEGFNPTNALTKAVIINSTRNLQGAYTADNGVGGASEDRPTFGQGWGRPVLNDSLFFPGDPTGDFPLERTYLIVLSDTPNGLLDPLAINDGRGTIVADLKPAIMTGDVHEFTFEATPGEDLHLTLAWSDPPPTAPTSVPLVNDLDLELLGPDPADPAQTVIWRPDPGTSSVPGVDPNRVWEDGYTQLGTALCPSGTGPECEAQCPPGEPEHLYPQRDTAPLCDFAHRDPRNNVENIFLPASDVVGGTYIVRVIGYLVPGNQPFFAFPAQPDWVDADGPGQDIIDSDHQGYALVVSGRASVDRGFIHFDRAFYRCWDQATITLNDMTPATDAEVTVTSPLGDLETFSLASSGVTPQFPLAQARDASDFTVGDGIVSFLPGQVITASYLDDSPAGHVAQACAVTGSFALDLQGPPALSDPCEDRDGYFEVDEVTFVDVTVLNPSGLEIPSLQGTLSTTDPEVQILTDRAVFAPLPVPGSGTATARFSIVVDAGHLCPDTITFTLDLQAGIGCPVQLTFDLSLDSACGPGGPVATPPGEVPRDSLTVSKLMPEGVSLEWGAATGASTYDVYRGSFADLHASTTYNHIASLALGTGTCGTGQLLFEDADDARLEEGDFYYYLVSGVTACGLEGTVGFDSDGTERPAGGGCHP